MVSLTKIIAKVKTVNPYVDKLPYKVAEMCIVYRLHIKAANKTNKFASYMKFIHITSYLGHLKTRHS